jgi:hypothetical protein
MSMTTTTTLADVAATSLSAVRTLERHGLDYCCGGKQLFDEACAAKGLKPESVMQEIERPQAPDASERDWQTAPLDEIVKHIVGTHHEYLKLELPALGNRMNKVLAVGQRVLPAFCGMRLLFSKKLMFASLTVLNLGCLLRVASEVPAYEFNLRAAWTILPVSAITELTGVTLFVLNLSITLMLPPPTPAVLTQLG